MSVTRVDIKCSLREGNGKELFLFVFLVVFAITV